ncbi:MAG: metal ABC transporter ATP-binding protein [Clostridia bacterium]|nr:metal ABC transporter ATP-binding protein [Clostridia bacterium]
MNSAISVKNLSVSYKGVEAINDISLEINKGEFVCIIGPNGGGKTTFLNAVLGFLKPNCGGIEIFGGNIKKARSVMSYVPQTAVIDRSFPITVIETVMTAFLRSGLHPFKLYKKAERERALTVLQKVGLDSLAQRQISELSGGEFQRLLIARALAANPQILLLDEPTANIDAASADKIFEILAEINLSGVTVVTVTHDLSVAVSAASRLVCINRELVYCGSPELTDEIIKAMYGRQINLNGGYTDA